MRNVTCPFAPFRRSQTVRFRHNDEPPSAVAAFLAHRTAKEASTDTTAANRAKLKCSDMAELGRTLST